MGCDTFMSLAHYIAGTFWGEDIRCRSFTYLDIKPSKAAFLYSKRQLEVVKGFNLELEILKYKPCTPSCKKY